ncbi:MAG: bifunctional diaminohydroxyphosphoribosylaminopyrimidine deaminase/5-amino-6-(5-phosphoribosylamino)uracil reductase RibD [bacterium]
MADPSAPMQRAIAAAHNVRGHTSPNPWVGAVVVRDGSLVSVGATSAYGGAHAEAAALANIDAAGTTLFTTLEPCMPFEGKRTPPCVEAIVASRVSRVVVGIEDPHAPVRGAGVSYLRAHGIEVEVGDGAEAITSLMRPYLKFRSTGTPYCIAKFAVSLDGKVGAPAQGIRWLTSALALNRAHQDRAWVDAIMVGSGTVIADDPALTARPDGVETGHQPLRVVLDGRGRIDPGAKVFGRGALLCTTSSPIAWRNSVTATGAAVLELESDDSGVNLDQLFRVLGQRSVMSLLVEGGPSLLASLFEAELADEVHAYVAPRILGPDGIPLLPDSPRFDAEPLREVELEVLHPDVLIRGYTGNWSPA